MSNQATDFLFDIPNTWKQVPESLFPSCGIISIPERPCLFGFVPRDQLENTVSVYDHGATWYAFLESLEAELCKLERSSSNVGEINQYIADKVPSRNARALERIVPLMHEYVTLHGRRCYVSIMDNVSAAGESLYSIQVFVKVQDNLICFSTNFTGIDRGDPLNSAVRKNIHVDEMINVVLRTLRW